MSSSFRALSLQIHTDIPMVPGTIWEMGTGLLGAACPGAQGRLSPRGGLIRLWPICGPGSGPGFQASLRERPGLGAQPRGHLEQVPCLLEPLFPLGPVGVTRLALLPFRLVV